MQLIYFAYQKDGQLYLGLKDEVKVLKTTLYEFFSQRALSFGSSLEGRLYSMAVLTGHRLKPPLIISNDAKEYYLCTRSIKATDCLLINYGLLESIKGCKDGSVITFFGGKTLHTNVDKRIWKRQNSLMRQYFRYYFSQKVL